MRKRDQSKNKFYVILPGRGLLKFTLTLFTKWVSELMHQIEEVGCVGCCPGYSRSSRALIRQDSFGSFNDASPHAATTCSKVLFFFNAPSSNRAYGSPVHGFPMFFTARLAPVSILRWLEFYTSQVDGRENPSKNGHTLLFGYEPYIVYADVYAHSPL